MSINRVFSWPSGGGSILVEKWSMKVEHFKWGNKYAKTATRLACRGDSCEACWETSDRLLSTPHGRDTETDKRNSSSASCCNSLQISWRKEQAWFNFVSTKVFLMRRFLCARQVKRDRFNHIPWLNKRWRSSYFISNFISGWLSSRYFFLWLQVSSVSFETAVKTCSIQLRLWSGISLLNVFLTIRVRPS